VSFSNDSFKIQNLLGELMELNHLLKSERDSVDLSDGSDQQRACREGEGLPRANVIRPANQFCCAERIIHGVNYLHNSISDS